MEQAFALEHMLVGACWRAELGSAYDWHVPRHAGEDDGGNQHDHEDNPAERLVVIVASVVMTCSVDEKLV